MTNSKIEKDENGIKYRITRTKSKTNGNLIISERIRDYSRKNNTPDSRGSQNTKS